MIHPVLVNPVISPLVDALDPVAWQVGSSYPAVLALLYDANKAPTRELTGEGHTFNSSILPPQYQLNADGSYTNVGTGPAVDVIDGEKWLRSCGAITNLFAGGTSTARSVSLTAQAYTLQVFGSGSVSCSYGTATVGTPLTFTATAGSVTFTPTGATLWMLTATSYPVPYTPPGTTMPASNATATNGSWFALPDGSPLWHALAGGPETDGVELVTNGDFSDGLTGWYQTAAGHWSVYDGAVKSSGTLSYLYQTTGLLALGAKVRVSFTVKDPGTVGSLILSLDNGGPTKSWLYSTFTAGDRITFIGINTTNNIFYFYPNRGWNGSIDNISIQRIKPQPLTLATRVMMGVGGEDLVTNTSGNVLTPLENPNVLLAYNKSSDGKTTRIIACYDGTQNLQVMGTWPRNAIINRITQVNTAGTHFRIGYMIEGTNTAIQWISWQVYDGSFEPSTLYRLMLGYNNAYPMWFSRIAVWNKQMDDSAILEALNG